jgi:prepilin-type N-terminal cleavage/methylation domain-containing protein
VLKEIRGRRDEDGFTLVEMALVLVIASIVLVMATQGLTSFTNAASANDSIVRRQQTASTVVAQLERDIRSASGISIPAGSAADDELQLAIPGGGGATTDVRWVYDPSSGTFGRQTQATDGSFQPAGYSASGVANDPGAPVFTYYGADASEIPASATSDIALCATAVAIDLQLSGGASGGSYEERAEVALTDQAQALTAPGNGQCGST